FLSTKNLIPHHKSFLISAIITILIQIVLLKFIDNRLIYLLLPLLLVHLIHNNWYWIWYVIKDIKKDKNLYQSTQI
ncbi:hypothetical protein, partial [Staphylococcus lugdunensis]|uniref:hypothetical protein n=1 Tax=Staphylococcus lugdunensis TaxID=28035 RepID=UPI00197E400C